MSTPENEFNPCRDCQYFTAAKEELTECMNERSDAWKQLERGRDYLMTVEADMISINDALVAFGFSRDGMHWAD